MDSKQIFMIVVIVTALSTVMIATPAMAQNMTGENMTGKVASGRSYYRIILRRDQNVLLMLKESRDVDHKGLQEPIRMGILMGTGMMTLAVTGMEKTVQMAMEMVTINKDLVKIMVIPLVAPHSFLLFQL